MRTLVLASLALSAACGGSSSSGGSTGAVAPAASSAEAFQSFMRAAADSNLTRMAQLWGSSNGSAAETGQPNGWEKRLVVIQAYLKNDSTRLVSDVAMTGDASRRQATIALYRDGCMKQLPATLVRSRSGGWLVEVINLQALGNPARPCEGAQPPPDLTR